MTAVINFHIERVARRLTRLRFRGWHARAEPPWLEYHRGLLILDRSPAFGAGRGRAADGGEDRGCGFQAAEDGLVHLVQCRNGPFDFSYLAVKAGTGHPAEVHICCAAPADGPASCLRGGRVMALQIVTAEERLAQANSKTTMAIFGPSGVGKTSLLKTLPPETTLCVDLEAGMKSVQGWPGDSIPVRAWPRRRRHRLPDRRDRPGGRCRAPSSPRATTSTSPRPTPTWCRLIAQKRIVFVDSITDLTRQGMAWAKTRPEAFSEKTGKPDVRGAYGLLAREVIALLEAPAARARQDGDLRRHPRARRRRLQPRALAAADGGRQGRARAAGHRRPGRSA